MCEFFRGWRRKIGVAALLLACLVIGLWTRSSTVTDRVDCHCGWHGLMQSVVSSGGSLSWERQDQPRLPIWKMGAAGQSSQARRAMSPISLTSELVVLVGRPQPRLDAPDINWNWRWCGFGAGAWSSHRTTLWVMPDWFVTTLLTLISAFLLISSPRQSSHQKITEPVCAEGK